MLIYKFLWLVFKIFCGSLLLAETSSKPGLSTEISWFNFFRSLFIQRVFLSNFGSNLLIPLGIRGILLFMLIAIFWGFIGIFTVNSIKILWANDTSCVTCIDLGYFGDFLDGIIVFGIGYRVWLGFKRVFCWIRELNYSIWKGNFHV